MMIDTPLADDGLQPRPPADALLHAGDTVAGWEVVDATGHSPNQLALWDGTRVLGADAAYAELPPYLEWGTHPTRSPSTWRRSTGWTRCAGALHPKPRRPDDDPGERFADAREAVAEMVRRVEAAGEGNAWEITCRLTGDSPIPSRGRRGSRACSASTEESDEVGGGDRGWGFRLGGGVGRGQRRREGDGLRARAEGRRDDGALRRQRLASGHAGLPDDWAELG